MTPPAVGLGREARPSATQIGHTISAVMRTGWPQRTRPTGASMNFQVSIPRFRDNRS